MWKVSERVLVRCSHSNTKHTISFISTVKVLGSDTILVLSSETHSAKRNNMKFTHVHTSDADRRWRPTCWAEFFSGLTTSAVRNTSDSSSEIWLKASCVKSARGCVHKLSVTSVNSEIRSVRGWPVTAAVSVSKGGVWCGFRRKSCDVKLYWGLWVGGSGVRRAVTLDSQGWDDRKHQCALTA